MQAVSFKPTDDLPASGILTTTPVFKALQGQPCISSKNLPGHFLVEADGNDTRTQMK